MSYEQLTVSSRRMFRRLAAVRGPDFDAALAAVAGEVPIEEAWDALDSLVDVGLLQDTPAGWYRCFQDLVRLFALERLHEEEAAAELTRRRVLAGGAAVAGTAALLGPLSSTASAAAPSEAGTKPTLPTIVLVHGGFADASCWNGVIEAATRPVAYDGTDGTDGDRSVPGGRHVPGGLRRRPTDRHHPPRAGHPTALQRRLLHRRQGRRRLARHPLLGTGRRRRPAHATGWPLPTAPAPAP
ncbi:MULTISPECIES: hypothetical protein [unclassified Streptomyces]|uniref:hypothetical protein n=1 Tax=unclassified Streptomyces TaxID=2593676 RepID=UPI002E1302F5|nr:hypothetical protein OG457_45080 [Streptomyces sp. NBC_01207]WTA23987.1 hypothetical protein OG365_38755 [Streptomyces sp. NBC_00853]